MPDSWTEIWSVGRGARRMYCGIATTPEGFAVDTFRGLECIESTVHPSRAEAERVAASLRRRYGPGESPRADAATVPPAAAQHVSR